MRRSFLLAGFLLRTAFTRRRSEFLVFAIVIPIAVITLTGLAFGSFFTNTKPSVYACVLDDGPVGKKLKELLEKREDVEVKFTDDLASLEEDVKKGKVGGAIVVEKGFSEKVEKEGKGEVKVLASEESKEQRFVALSLAHQLAGEVMKTEEFQHVFAEKIEENVRSRVNEYLEKEGVDEEEREKVLKKVEEYFSKGDFFGEEGPAPDGEPPVKVVEEVVTPEKVGGTARIGFFVAGYAVMFLLMSLSFGALSTSRSVRDGTFRRLVQCGFSASEYLTGVNLYLLVRGGIQLLVLFGVGLAIFKVRVTNPLGLVLSSAASVVCALGLGSLITALSRSEEEGSSLTILLTLVLTPLGGGWWPLEIAPPLFHKLALLSPVYWMLEGMKGSIYRGWTTAEILPYVAVCFGFGLLTAVAGYYVLSKKLSRSL